MLCFSLNSACCRWYALTGKLDVAISHMVKVLTCSNQSPATQKLFMNDFFRIVQVVLYLTFTLLTVSSQKTYHNIFMEMHFVSQSTGSKVEVKMLELPLIVVASLKVTFEDHRTYASSASVSLICIVICILGLRHNSIMMF